MLPVWSRHGNNFTNITVAHTKKYPVYPHNRSALELKYHSKCWKWLPFHLHKPEVLMSFINSTVHKCQSSAASDLPRLELASNMHGFYASSSIFDSPLDQDQGCSETKSPEKVLNCSSLIIWCAWYADINGMLSCWNKINFPQCIVAAVCRWGG